MPVALVSKTLRDRAMTCVLLDIDGTLFRKPSTEALFILYLLRHGKLRLPQLAAALWFYVRWARRFRRHVARKNKAYLVGLRTQDVASLADRFVREELKRRFRPIVLRRLKAHRERGDTITLLTGAPDFLAEPIARLVGAQAWSATYCARRDGRFTADPPLRHPLGPDKVVCARVLCQKVGVALQDCTAYGDAVHDVVLLQQVRTAIAVYPDKGLLKAARKHRWEVIKTDTSTLATYRAGPRVQRGMSANRVKRP